MVPYPFQLLLTLLWGKLAAGDLLLQGGLCALLSKHISACWPQWGKIRGGILAATAGLAAAFWMGGVLFQGAHGLYPAVLLAVYGLLQFFLLWVGGQARRRQAPKTAALFWIHSALSLCLAALQLCYWDYSW